MEEFASTRNLIYIILPLLIVLVLVSLGLTFHIRQRRAASASYPALRRPVSESDGPLAPHNHRQRNAALGAVNSTEGLNELGEAPPPYDRKKDAAEGGGAHGDAAGIRLRDLEEGNASPPEYIAVPSPVVARESR